VGVRTVNTARTRLEPWTEAHTPALLRINADPDVMRYIGTGEPPSAAATEEQSRRFARHWTEFGFGLWAVVPLAGADAAQVVGFAGLAHPLWLAGEAARVEVGWRLARDAWGRGYATEVARAALRVAFDELGLAEVVAYIHPGNRRSQRVAERLGMHLQRTIPRPQLGFELLVWALRAERARRGLVT
jgi:RimJ/RimL family protein N-acetyltransferase